MASHEFSLPLLCDVIGLARSSFYYKSQASDDSKLRRDIEGVCLSDIQDTAIDVY